jgi:hypothetical protein
METTMSKIEDHAEKLLDLAADARIAIKAKNWNHAKHLLSQLGAQRSIITAIMEAVEELQPKAAVMPMKRRYPNGHKRTGDLSRYIVSQIGHMAPGQVVMVTPQDDFTEQRIRSACASVAGRMWGQGNYITAWVPGKGVEVMRVQ